MDKWLLGRDSIVNKYTKAIRSCHKNMQLQQQRWFVSRWFYHEARSLESSEDLRGLRVVSPECWFPAFLHFVCVRWSLGGRGVGWTRDWWILQSLLPSLWYSNDSNRSVMSLSGTIFPLSVCNVPQWSRSDDVSVHRVSTTAQTLQRGSEWVCVCGFCMCSRTSCVCTEKRVCRTEPQNRGAVFHWSSLQGLTVWAGVI